MGNLRRRNTDTAGVGSGFRGDRRIGSVDLQTSKCARKSQIGSGAAIARGASVCAIAGGKIDDSALAGSYEIGIAVEAAAADGDVIEVIPVGSIGVVNP